MDFPHTIHKYSLNQTLMALCLIELFSNTCSNKLNCSMPTTFSINLPITRWLVLFPAWVFYLKTILIQKEQIYLYLHILFAEQHVLK